MSYDCFIWKSTSNGTVFISFSIDLEWLSAGMRKVSVKVAWNRIWAWEMTEEENEWEKTHPLPGLWSCGKISTDLFSFLCVITHQVMSRYKMRSLVVLLMNVINLYNHLVSNRISMRNAIAFLLTHEKLLVFIVSLEFYQLNPAWKQSKVSIRL